jgi:hypothetical protein
VDIHENVGEFSDAFEISYGTLGDVTWDGSIDVLDVTRAIYMILNWSTDNFTDAEVWAADMNSDTFIDVFDIVLIIDIIMDGALAKMTYADGPAAVYQQGNTVKITSTIPVAGIQIILTQPAEVTNLTGMEMVSQNDLVLLYTLSGQILMGEEISMLELPDGVSVKEIILASPRGERIAADFTLIPEAFAIHPNYPNPFNPSTTIRIDMDQATHLSVVVYNLMGEEVTTLVNSEMTPGYHQLVWNGKNTQGHEAASGIYLIHVQTAKHVRTVKATLLR